jgi:hypothetical protein
VFHRAERALLGVELFDDGLDHETTVPEGGEIFAIARLETDALLDVAPRLRREPPLLHLARQGFPDARAGFLEGWRVRIDQHDAMSRGRGDLCDSASHRAGPEHADLCGLAQRHQRPAKVGFRFSRKARTPSA